VSNTGPLSEWGHRLLSECRDVPQLPGRRSPSFVHRSSTDAARHNELASLQARLDPDNLMRSGVSYLADRLVD
jgi:hypothetical protein